MSKIKICGLSRIEDIVAVNSVLPDYIGFVFAPSPRRIDGKTAIILRECLDHRITTVGVFVNQEIETIADLWRRGVIDLAQLHGDEDTDYIARLKAICGCAVIKAIGVGDELPSLPEKADYCLFDSLSSKRGGSGKAFNWSLLKHYYGSPYFLAGGLTVANISNAINYLAPYCIDVSSGAETNGIKDPDKIKEIVRLVRKAL